METVVLLSQLRQKPDDYIDVDVDVAELESTSAEALKVQWTFAQRGPKRSGDLRRPTKDKAQYMILESYTDEWKIEFCSVEYDISQVVKEIHESGLFDLTPYWCRITVQLLKTGEISHGTVLGEVMKENGYKDPWYAISEEYWDKTFEKMGIE